MLLISVCAGRWQLNGIKCAIDAGFDVLALDANPDAAGFDFATKSIVVDVTDTNAVLDVLRKSNIRPDGAVSFVAEVGMPAVAAIRDQYNLPGIDTKITKRLTNKVIQREYWQKKGLPNPEWIHCCNFDDVEKAKSQIVYPVIVKPSDSAGSRGVNFINSEDSLITAAKNAFSYSRNNTILIESVLQGSEYTVETFSCNNKTHVLAVTVKRKMIGTNNTVADQLMTPQIEESLEKKIRLLACEALDTLGVNEGPGHVEIMSTDNGKMGLIEAAARGGGFMVFDYLVPLFSGYDLVSATAMQAVGIDPPPFSLKKESKNVVLLRFIPSKMGIVKSIDGFEDANRIEGVKAESFVSIGEEVQSASTDGDRLAYIVTNAKNHKTAIELADKAEDLIEIDVSLD